jgi:pyridoxine 4-dehydrogenase
MMIQSMLVISLLAQIVATIEAYGSFVGTTSTSSFVTSKIWNKSKGVARSSRKNDGIVMFQGNSLSSGGKSLIENKYSYTKLGNLVVPSVGIGTISWSSSSLTTLENLELQSVINEACQSDAAFFDTAERYGSHIKTAMGLGYGETELLLQKLIKRSPYVEGNGSKSPIVATKFTPTPWRTTVDSVVAACEQSRQRLGVEQIDLYQLHMPDIVQPFRFLGLGKSKDEVYWKGLAECHRLGLVKNVGVSNYGPTLVEKCQDTLGKYDVPLASNQIAYSLIGRQNGSQETVDKCSDLGVKVLAYYPFAMGLLTGKYSSSIESLSDSMITSLTSSKKSNLELKDLENYASGMSSLLLEMETIAKERNKSIAQIALNYIMCKGAIPIPGSGSIDQVKDNIGAMGWRLSETEVNLLENEADKLGFSFEGAGFKRTSEKFVGYGVEKWVLD